MRDENGFNLFGKTSYPCEISKSIEIFDDSEGQLEGIDDSEGQPNGIDVVTKINKKARKKCGTLFLQSMRMRTIVFL